MALVRVKEKKPAEGAKPQFTYVDEAWLERWPDDFELAPEEPAAPAPAPAAAEPEQRARRSNDF